MRLKGKTALIAGSGRNNGRAIAVKFAQEGADLILVAKQLGDRLQEVARECEASGVQVMHLLADVTEPEEVNRLVHSGLQRFGKIDVLVSAVGMRPHKKVWEYTYDEWRQIFAINLHATFYLARAIAPSMIERKSGSIIALGGLAALTAQESAAAIVASKHGLYGLIKSLALDLGPHGVRANMLALSHIRNERRNPEWYAHAGGDPHTAEEASRTPLGREGRPDEVASVALFLASDASSYITGDRVVCGGGRYM